MTKRVIKHEVKLEKSVKFILSALAFGVLAHAFVPAFNVTSAIAATTSKKVAKTTGLGTVSVRLVGPVRLSGQLGLGGKLGLGGAIKCEGCVPK